MVGPRGGFGGGRLVFGCGFGLRFSRIATGTANNVRFLCTHSKHKFSMVAEPVFLTANGQFQM
jgi:hypothetical protein